MFNNSFSRRLVISCFVICALFLLLLQPATAGGKVTEFSADQVNISKDGKEKVMTTYYFSPKKARMEVRGGPGSGKMIGIIREDKKIFYFVFPEKKMYVEKALTEKDMMAYKKPMMPSSDPVKTEDLGTEKVQGYKCKKRSSTYTYTLGKQEITKKIVTWTTAQFDMPIRTQDDKGNVTELRNIKKGKQPDKLFELPADCKKVKSIMEAMRSER